MQKDKIYYVCSVCPLLTRDHKGITFEIDSESRPCSRSLTINRGCVEFSTTQNPDDLKFEEHPLSKKTVRG